MHAKNIGKQLLEVTEPLPTVVRELRNFRSQFVLLAARYDLRQKP
jgi:hypothetical protein